MRKLIRIVFVLIVSYLLVGCKVVGLGIVLLETHNDMNEIKRGERGKTLVKDAKTGETKYVIIEKD